MACQGCQSRREALQRLASRVREALLGRRPCLHCNRCVGELRCCLCDRWLDHG